MTICLLPNCCFLSETSRTIALARALRDRGAELRIATHGGTYAHLLTEAGFAHDVIGPGWDAARCAAFVRAVPGIGDPSTCMWTDDELRSYARAEAAYFAEHDVTVAVTGWTLTALLSTRLAGIPLVTEHAGSFLPPLFERGRLPAPARPLGLPLERWMPAALRTRLYNMGLPRLDIYTGGLNRVAAELGLEGVPSFPALLLGDITLVTDVPEVLGVSRADIDGWTPRRPASYRPGTRMRLAGPLYAGLDIPVSERVERFLDGGSTPVAYVAITSSREQLVRDVIERLRPAGVRVLVAGTAHQLGDVEDPDVMVEPLLPSHLIMPRVDLAVIAGGQGSVQTALASGLPFVGIPLQPEQDANVVLVERQGAARRVAENRAGTADLTRAAQEVLTDGRFRAAARRLQDAFRRVDGPAAGAELILAAAAESAKRPRATGHRSTLSP